MKKLMVLDFDGTLFDTSLVKADVAEAFIACGISEELVSRTYQDLRLKGYSVEKHCEEISKVASLDRGQFTAVLGDIQKNWKNYVFPEVLDFLNHARSQGYKLAVCTYGEQEFQTQKIACSQLGCYFDKVVITRNKDKVAELNALLVDVSEFVFVDDSRECCIGIRNAIPKIRVFWMNRKGETNHPCLQSVKNFIEVADSL